MVGQFANLVGFEQFLESEGPTNAILHVGNLATAGGHHDEVVLQFAEFLVGTLVLEDVGHQVG